MRFEDVLMFFAGVITVIADAYIVFNYFNSFYERKDNYKVYLIGVFTYMISMLIMSYIDIPNKAYINLPIFACVIGSLALLLYKGSARTIIISTMIYLLFYLVGEMIVFFSINLLFSATVESLQESIVHNLPYLLYDRILLFLLFKAVIQMGKSSHNRLLPKDFMALTFVSVISLYIILTIFLQDSFGDDISELMNFFVSLGLFVANVIIYNLFQKSTKYARIEVEQSLILQNIESSEKRYGEVVAIQNQTKSMLHDINNHIACAKGMIEDREGVAAKYIDELEQKVGHYASQAVFGNSIIDTILYSKTAKAEELGIDIFTSLDMDKNIKIDPVDICTIFSNALDNAIEACEEIEKERRFIRLKAVQSEDILYIKVVNSSANRNKIGDEFRTTKREKIRHGIGLKSIQAAVESYSGSIRTEYKDGVFELSIMLNKI